MTTTTTISDPNGVLKEPSMSADAQKGHKVVVTERSISNGWPDDQEKARKFLKPGGIYTVEKMERADWSSSVILQEIPGERFNSVHFIDCD